MDPQEGLALFEAVLELILGAFAIGCFVGVVAGMLKKAGHFW